MLSCVKAVPPEFVSVTVCAGALCPIGVTGKVKDAGDKVSVAGATPVPLNETT